MKFIPLRSACLLVLALFSATALPRSLGAAPVEPPRTVLFIGNSFTYGHGSPVRFFHPERVTDLNGDGIGGVPALFKTFTDEARLNYAVSLETSPGKNLDWHLAHKRATIDRAWDDVVIQGYSLLDEHRPGDPALLIAKVKELAALFTHRNPQVEIWLLATWSRADQTYPPSGHWHGQPIEQMARDVRAGYDRAAATSPAIRGVLPVGQAWNRAMDTGVADPNPYDGETFGQLDLWTWDHYHASAYGYYLDALVVFGRLTGRDPRVLGKDERAAFELGMSPTQATALQQVAHDQLAADTAEPASR